MKFFDNNFFIPKEKTSVTDTPNNLQLDTAESQIDEQDFSFNDSNGERFNEPYRI